jgi:chromosome segregation ATPase
LNEAAAQHQQLARKVEPLLVLPRNVASLSEEARALAASLRETTTSLTTAQQQLTAQQGQLTEANRRIAFLEQMYNQLLARLTTQSPSAPVTTQSSMQRGPTTATAQPLSLQHMA